MPHLKMPMTRRRVTPGHQATTNLKGDREVTAISIEATTIDRLDW
jgi:hypothetical protein